MDGCEDGNQIIVHDVKAKKHRGPYCGVKKPPTFISAGNQVEVTLKKGKTPHPQNGRGVQFMVGYQSVGKGAKAPPAAKGGRGPPGKGPGGRPTVGRRPAGGGRGPAGGGRPMGNFDPGHDAMIEEARVGRPVAAKPAPAPSKPKKPVSTGIQTLPSGRVNVNHFSVDENGKVTYVRPTIKIKSATSGDIKTAPNSGDKPQGPSGKNGSSGGMVNGKCMDPPDMGCNNKNWKPHAGTASSQPIDINDAPDGLNKINMTELAAWVNGDVNVQPTVNRPKPTTQTTTSTTTPGFQHMGAKNLWESKRRVPDGLAVVYGSDFMSITNGTTYSDGGDDINLINDEEHLRRRFL